MTTALSESRIDRAAVALFAAFAVMMTAFNRGFAYAHLTFSGHPVYVTEIFLATAGILIALDGRRRRALTSVADPAVRRVFLLIGLFLLLVAVKLASGVPKFGIEAVRQAALGYYCLAAVVSYAFLTDPPLREGLFPWIAGASVLSTVIFLSINGGWLHANVGLLRDFHGFGAFIWLGIVAAYILATGRANFWSHRVVAVIFLVQWAAGIMMAGRSEFLALMFTLGGIAAIRFRRMTPRERISVALSAIVVAGCLGLRFADVLKFRSQDNWKQSWQSYRWGAFALRNAVSGTASAGSEASPGAAKDVIEYNAKEGTLRSVSAQLNDPHPAADDDSASVNNILWRKELWRLSLKAVLKNGPVFGLPLGTMIKFYAFGRLIPGRVDLHNSHLAILYRFGGAGFLIYAALMLTSVTLFARAALAGSDAALFYLGALIYLALLASFNVMLEGPFGAMAYWGVLGAGLADNRILIDHTKETA